MRISVIVPSFLRPVDLARCLQAFAKQKSKPAQIIVVVRDSDVETLKVVDEMLADLPSLQSVNVFEAGVIAAMNAGLKAATGEIIALTDDDAAPRPDWLERIQRHFEAQPEIGGVGGRDWQWYDNRVNDGQSSIVGKLQWIGRTVGNHHLGVGPARDVDILKGANCAYRAEPLRRIGFDTRLRGGGAQVHWEMSLCLAMRREGWRLIYDPEVAVDHYPAKRSDADLNARGGFHGPSYSDMVCNETFILLEHLHGLRRVSFLLWGLIVGTSGTPGPLQVLRMIGKDRYLGRRWVATLRGRLSGIGYFLRLPRARPVTRTGLPIVQ